MVFYGKKKLNRFPLSLGNNNIYNSEVINQDFANITERITNFKNQHQYQIQHIQQQSHGLEVKQTGKLLLMRHVLSG